jgi:Glycosyl transferase family 2
MMTPDDQRDFVEIAGTLGPTPGSRPLVSVLMPIHNGEAFLFEALSSLLAQTYDSWELVAVLDRCIDKSEQILNDTVPVGRLRIVVSEERGVANALNCGLRLCRGEYIARFDADDVCLPNRFMDQIDFLQKNPAIDVLGGDAIVIDENSEEVGRRSMRASSIERRTIWRNSLVHPSTMLRKSTIVRLGAYDTNLKSCEDYGLWLKVIANRGQIASLDKNLIRYRVSSSQHSHSSGRLPFSAAVSVHRLRRSASRSLKVNGFSQFAASSAWTFHQSVIGPRLARRFTRLWRVGKAYR